MTTPAATDVTTAFECRVCHNPDLITFLKLGPTPAPNGFLSESQLNASEVYYPLDICFCQKCGMVQLAHVVNPEVMFKDYDYIPSTSRTMTDHFTALAQYATQKATLGANDLVMDIGSNDGTLLKNFLKDGIFVLGVDPAENLAKVANDAGIETVNALFTANLAKTLATKRKAKVILGTNVFAHVPNVHDFLEGAKTLLTDDGLLIVEFPYLMDMVEKVEFDTIYQEHFSYFGLHPILNLVQQHGMGLVDATRTPVHGGSIRITISKTPCTTPATVQAMIENEIAAGLMKPETYFKFAQRVGKIRHDLVNLLWELKASGKRIVGYGAPAKGNVLLNYYRIGSETLDYVVDSIPRKQGKFTPGTHLQIFPEAKLMEDKPDYALLLSWNFADEILSKQTAFRKQGGKFILPIPDVRVV